MIKPKHQKLKGREFQFLYYSSLALLLLCAALLISPSISDSSHAEDNITIPLSTEIGIKSQTTISLALASQINLEVIPKSTGATSFSSTQLSISTNSNDGYSLYLQAGDDGARSDGSLIPVTNTIDSKIINTTKQNAPLFDASNPDNSIGSNSYGYALSKDTITESTLYSHIPTSADPSKVVISVDSATATTGDYPYGDTYNLAFGTNIDTSLPAGQYSGAVTVSAVANPKTLTSLYDITYMQDMNPTICENTRTGYTKQLVDNRDGNSYWVAKLADENCWMTQNLAYTISREMIDNGSINSTNTDLQPNQTGGWGQLYVDSSGIIYWNNNDAVTYKATPTYHDLSIIGGNSNNFEQTGSWNLGDYVLLNPTSFESCTSDLKNPGQAHSISVLQNGSIDSCMNIVNVSDWTPTFTAREATITRDDFVRKTVSGYDSTEPNDATTQTIWIPRSEATNGADKDEAGNYIAYTYTGLVSVDFSSKTYDPHYLIGNYYQYNTATTGTAGGILSNSIINAPSTICPKGWTLPKRWSSSFGDYSNLFATYNHKLSDIMNQAILVPAGAITRDGFSSIGSAGQFPIKSIHNNTYPNNAYFMTFDSSQATVLNTWMRPSGLTIRCLARYE